MIARTGVPVLAYLLLTGTLSAQKFELRGTVVLVDPTGATSPVEGVEVTVMETGDGNTTKAAGLFRIQLPQGYKPGRQITVVVAMKDWAIWQPIDGKTPIPDDLLTIRLLPKGSKKFWTDQFIESFIESTKEKAKLQVKLADKQEKPKPVDFGPMIREWAEKYGFTPEEARKQIDQWIAEVQRNQDDFYKLGLAAFAERNFRKAGDLFTEAAERSAKELRVAKQEEAKLVEETVRNYRAAGDARSNDYEFESALSAYEKALDLVDRGQHAELWAAIQVDVGWANSQLAQTSEGAAAHRRLARAVASDRAALEVYTREQSPENWAWAQGHLGIALAVQGTITGGEAGRQLIAQAVAAFRAALEVFTREQLPEQWAATQTGLGLALREQVKRTGGEEGRQLLAQAVAAFDAALEVDTLEQSSPRDWAAAQHDLGDALLDQGMHTGGEAGRQLLAQAVAACHAALKVRTREQFPQDWAATQVGLGNALQEQGKRTGGEEGRQLLAQAETAYRAALEVYTRERSPQPWAAAQTNLGAALREQGLRSGGEEGARLLAQAVVAHRWALEIYTREQFPQQWALMQENLGITLTEQARLKGGEEGRRLLGQAVAAYSAALEVYTREQLPQDWAGTQQNLGTVFLEQAMRTAGDEGWQLLERAVAAYRAALEVPTREQLPQEWAKTKYYLGAALEEQGRRASETEGRQLMEQAVVAFRDALTVRTRQALPVEWAQTHDNLAAAYLALGKWQDGAASLRNVLEINPDYPNAYSALANVHHEKLFDFAAALALHENWLKRHPEDLAARADFAEALFTVGRFERTVGQISQLLPNPELDAGPRAGLRGLEIAALLGQHRHDLADPKLRELIDLVRTQPPDFHVEWTWEGTKHFIQTDDELMPVRAWLLSLIGALESANRDGILEGLRAVANSLAAVQF